MEFLLLLIFRLFNAALTQTYFQPDEFWQSLEVAHRLVFGYGYTTWEWRDGRSLLSSSDSASGWWDSVVVGSPVRSVAYPSLFVPVYWGLKVLNLDDTFLLTLLPRLVQAVFAALGDWIAALKPRGSGSSTVRPHNTSPANILRRACLKLRLVERKVPCSLSWYQTPGPPYSISLATLLFFL
ncbi:hypothetical protein A4X13_0g4183 [Tilletia indica]|uniref:Mannosyltransferase n=1 Tax=Tilletia indica TaxID=43049 RepID=A0A177TQW7_9BASI|nr:hypothetical protein A4X13_0g4183 [Tilletia indica]